MKVFDWKKISWRSLFYIESQFLNKMSYTIFELTFVSWTSINNHYSKLVTLNMFSYIFRVKITSSYLQLYKTHRTTFPMQHADHYQVWSHEYRNFDWKLLTVNGFCFFRWVFELMEASHSLRLHFDSFENLMTNPNHTFQFEFFKYSLKQI